MDVGVRLVEVDDAPALADLLRTNREFLAPWEPVRSDDYFTQAGQLARLEQILGRYRQDLMACYVIQVDGRIVGQVTLYDVVRGVLESAHLGYWVGQAFTGRGVASAAVAHVVRHAFTELRLHRLQAGTLVHNIASERVLRRNGFTPIGLAPRSVRIAGRWQDHMLYQRLNDDWRPRAGCEEPTAR